MLIRADGKSSIQHMSAAFNALIIRLRPNHRHATPHIMVVRAAAIPKAGCEKAINPGGAGERISVAIRLNPNVDRVTSIAL